MSADKYAQFIAEQQRKLSVSGVNAVDLQEKKQMSKADIAKLREPKDDIDADDLEALRNKEHLKKEEVEALDEILDSPGKELKYALKNISSKVKAKLTGDKDTVRKRERGEESFKKNAAKKKDEREMDSYRNKLAGKALRDMGRKTGLGMYYDKIHKEEAEQVDEIRAIKGVHANRMQKAPSITPSKVRYKGRGSKPKVQTDLNITASYEISADESAYLEEMVGKGKLNDILMHHKDNMRHHEKMLNHHMVQADKAEEVGDERGFDHHTGEAIHHEMQAQHHQIRFDHASGLKARANAQREMKAAQSAMKSASEKIAAAKQDKRDWG